MRAGGRVYILAALATGLAIACASSRPLTLDPPSAIASDPIVGGDGRRVAVVLPFSDEREIRDRCGMHKSAFYREVGDVLCRDQPTAWLARLLADELRAAGFQVVEQAELGEQGVRIAGELFKLFVEPVIFHVTRVETDIQVKLLLTSRSGLEAERTLFVKRNSIGGSIRSPSVYKRSLDRANHALMAEMVKSVIALLNRYPGLGAAGEDTSRTASE